MDSWYATKGVMLHIETLHKVYYCPLKTNRLVDDSGAQQSYRRGESLSWTDSELMQGERVKIRGFSKDHKVRLSLVALSSRRTDYVVTNSTTQLTTKAVQEACGFRWKIERLHHKAKQRAATVPSPNGRTVPTGGVREDFIVRVLPKTGHWT